MMHTGVAPPKYAQAPSLRPVALLQEVVEDVVHAAVLCVTAADADAYADAAGRNNLTRLRLQVLRLVLELLYLLQEGAGGPLRGKARHHLMPERPKGQARVLPRRRRHLLLVLERVRQLLLRRRELEGVAHHLRLLLRG